MSSLEPNFLDFIPISEDTVDDIIGRMDADVNAGVDPSDSAFTDTTPGGFYADLRTVAALEIERLRDYASTVVPAAMFPALGFGDYLDAWGVTLGLPRKDEVKATGEVTFSGSVGTLIPAGTVVSTQQSSPDDDPISFVTTESGTIPGGGSITLDIEAETPGATGNVAVGLISVPISPVSGGTLTSITNADATSGGADVESDALYKKRILLEFQPGQGAGTIADYEKWAVAYAPVGYASVEPLWSGAGTVRVVVTDQDNNPVAGSVVTGLQADLDPIAGEGRGRAPIGAIVTVATPALLGITVAANITLESGYTVTGAGGTIAVEDQIVEALQSYINTLKPGDDVILEKVSAQFFTVAGMYDVASVTLNGSASNVTVTALQVARLSLPVTLT